MGGTRQQHRNRGRDVDARHQTTFTSLWRWQRKLDGTHRARWGHDTLALTENLILADSFFRSDVDSFQYQDTLSVKRTEGCYDRPVIPSRVSWPQENGDNKLQVVWG